MAADREIQLLRERLCAAFCSFYKPGKNEDLTCLGYRAVAWFAAAGREFCFKAEQPRGSDSSGLLSGVLCPHCPFSANDCDYAAGVEGAPPCGGFILLNRALGDGTLSVDDIGKYELYLRMQGQVHDVAKAAREKGGEHVLGAADLHTHACYLIYGIMKPGEKERQIRPGSGHEEIFCLVSGRVVVRRDGLCIPVEAGQAFHLRGDESCVIENQGDAEAVYIISGGHGGTAAHH